MIRYWKLSGNNSGQKIIQDSILIGCGIEIGLGSLEFSIIYI